MNDASASSMRAAKRIDQSDRIIFGQLLREQTYVRSWRGKEYALKTTLQTSTHKPRDDNNAMDSSNLPVLEAKRIIDEVGYIERNGSGVGESVAVLEQNRFPFWTEIGLEFCQRNVLFDERIRPLLCAWFGRRCVLVHWLRYRAYPGHIICFRGGGLKAGRRRFMVHLLSRDSQVKYYGRSHLHELPTRATDYLFYEIEQSALDEAGLAGKELTFSEGGLVAFDARTCVEIQRGYALTFLFATEDVLSTWPPMYLPNLPRLHEKVSKMETSEIGVNFAFREPPKPEAKTSNDSSASKPDDKVTQPMT